MRKSAFFKLLLVVMSVFMILTGCAKNDPAVTETDSGTRTEAPTETEAETKKPNVPADTVDRQEIIDSYKFKNPWKTGITVEAADGKTIKLREVTIDIGGNGTPIEIFQISDVHFNSYYDDEDDTVKRSFKEWGGIKANNQDTIDAFKRCVNYAANSDCIMVTGDIMNFYSRANMDTMEKYVFNAKLNINANLRAKIIALSGNHDATFPGAWSNQTKFESNRKNIENLYSKYGQNLDYYSEVIDNRVMVVQIDNASRYDVSPDRFTASQVAALKNDIATAKSNGYVMLLFCHVPLPTYNSSDGYYTLYDKDAYASGTTSKEMYDLITNNADVIKGYFAGHNHADAYSEIVAKTSEGKPAFIPQYVLTAFVNGDGDMTRIILK